MPVATLATPVATPAAPVLRPPRPCCARRARAAPAAPALRVLAAAACALALAFAAACLTATTAQAATVTWDKVIVTGGDTVKVGGYYFKLDSKTYKLAYSTREKSGFKRTPMANYGTFVHGKTAYYATSGKLYRFNLGSGKKAALKSLGRDASRVGGCAATACTSTVPASSPARAAARSTSRPTTPRPAS